VNVLKIPMRLEYAITPGRATARFLRGMAEGRLLGQRCPSCRSVYVPPRGCCPTCAVATEEEVAVADTGTVTTFCVVNIPFEAQSVPVPFVLASILLDGADVPIYHLVLDVPAHEVRMGMRVRALWRPPGELSPTMESIRHFRPTGEPDAPEATWARHV
jgi:uncharacterized OB-fold protein